MTNPELDELLDYLEGGDPLKDRYDEDDLIDELAKELCLARREIARLKKSRNDE